MKIDERCLPYAEEMKTCGYCAEYAELVAASLGFYLPSADKVK